MLFVPNSPEAKDDADSPERALAAASLRLAPQFPPLGAEQDDSDMPPWDVTEESADYDTQAIAAVR